jgi:hypothetical protein
MRPEKIRILEGGAKAEGALGADAKVASVQYQGAIRRIQVRVGDALLVAAVPASGAEPAAGAAVRIAFDMGALHRMDANP